MMIESSALLIAIAVLVVFILVGVAFWARYKTVGADEAMVVTGSYLGRKNVMEDDSGRRIKIIRGGGAFILPIFQEQSFLSLLSHKSTIKTPEVYTEQGVPIMVNGVAIYKIGSTIEEIVTAAEQFMGKSFDELRAEAEEVLEGHLRAILGTMTVEAVYKNRDQFAQQVQEVAAKDLRKMGLQIVSFTIKDVTDANGYLEALGKPRIAEVRRDAEIAQARASSDSRIQQARAEEEARKAELLKETSIAEAEKEKELKIAEYKKQQDQKKAEADQAYKLQEAVTRQQVIEEEMKIELVKRQKQIELEEKEILLREREYDAQIKKKAEADRYAKEQTADGDRYQREASAKAEAEVIRQRGIAEAEAEKAKGLTAAEIIRQKGLAEAEAKERLAEAFEKFGSAAILDVMAKMLPELAERIAKPLGSIDSITVVDNGGDASLGANKVSSYVTNLMTSLPAMVKGATGFDLIKTIEDMSRKEHVSTIAPEVKPALPLPVESASA